MPLILRVVAAWTTIGCESVDRMRNVLDLWGLSEGAQSRLLLLGIRCDRGAGFGGWDGAGDGCYALGDRFAQCVCGFVGDAIS